MNINCILLYGNDTYLIKKTLDDLFQTNEINEADIEVYDYEENGIEVAITSAMTLPFLADKKGVVLRNCSFLSDKKNATEQEVQLLMQYCNFFNPTTVLILTAPYEKIDMRKKISKYLTKHIDTKAFITSKKTDSIYEYIKAEVTKNNLKIDPLALTQFVNRIGNDAQMVEQELNKLITYALDKDTITADMVYNIVTRDIDDNIFEIVNAFLDKNIDRTMEVYFDLKSIKIDPIWILNTITNKLQEILYTKELLRMKYKTDDIAKYFHASKGRMYYMLQNARNVDYDYLIEVLEAAEDLDFKIKSGQLDKFLGLELFLLKQE